MGENAAFAGAIEEEIKLTARHAVTLEQLLADEEILRLSDRQSPRDRSFRAVYLDTPDWKLLKARLAFRRRQEGERWRVGLKGGGDMIGGLSRRLEWEGLVDREVSAPVDLPDGEMKQRLLDILHQNEPLLPILETDFQRRVLLLRLESGSVAELALDAGRIRAGTLAVTLFEVELEGLSGPFQPVVALSERLLSRHADLTASRQSKFACGLELLVNQGLLPAKAVW
ncbi:MAG: CYTH domain-containing protein [Magnetococcales bacterium]|nr:CYTH domain-containing protein [Magnetococcales bacterium]